jgi:hypothetical protein
VIVLAFLCTRLPGVHWRILRGLVSHVFLSQEDNAQGHTKLLLGIAAPNHADCKFLLQIPIGTEAVGHASQVNQGALCLCQCSQRTYLLERR